MPEIVKEKNKLWIWILIILIFFVVLGIILREKIKIFLIKMKTNKNKRSSPREMPNFGGLRPTHNSSQPLRQIPRRILPPGQRPSVPRIPPKKPTKTSKELDDVLKKLKDLGNK
jgi:flagellar biosynthesis/type III secretory pathway M-ring protein FliF/YscJ